MTTNGDDVVVATKTAGSVEAPKASVTMLRSPAEQAAYEKSLHPGLLEGWNGGVNLGFAVTRGNSETKNLNIAFNATRKGFHDKLILYTNSIYATNDLPTASPHTTANSTGGGARYDHDFAPRVFGFVNGDFLSNALQDLNLRSTLGGGIGVHAIKNASTTLDLLAGLNYTHESYSAFTLPPAPPSATPRSSPLKTDSLAGLDAGGCLHTQDRERHSHYAEASSSTRTLLRPDNTVAHSISARSPSSTSGWAGRIRSRIFMSATRRPERKRTTCRLRPV